MKVIIVGGVAGGASCAARLRRLDEQAEILMVERGPYVSFANCGLPYHVGGVIEHESDLLVANERVFREQFAVDCRTGCEAIGISAEEKTFSCATSRAVRSPPSPTTSSCCRPGAPSIRPPLPGIDLPGIFRCDVPDAREIREWIERGTSFLDGHGQVLGLPDHRPPMRAVVVGGGFIGLEMAENLPPRLRGDRRRDGGSGAHPARPRVRADRRRTSSSSTASTSLSRTASPASSRPSDGPLEVSTQSGKSYPADIVILALGVRPETRLATMAGIEIGALGGIRVDDQMRTSDPDIFAVGDAIEVRDFVTGEWSLIALAGRRTGRPASRPT